MNILIVGAGLLGASLGLALTGRGHTTWLRDSSPHAAGLARDLGAGNIWTSDQADPDLVIVATPPDVAGDVINDSLATFPHAIVTDVASVKSVIASEVTRHRDRYIGSHPMAGRERSGAIASDSDLFVGRPWVVVPTEETTPAAISMIRQIALDVGALPLDMNARAHDDAVARVSHVPQLVSSLLAARLTRASAQALGLSGQGVRDVTRLAHSDPALWSAIIAGNAGPVNVVLREIADDLGHLIASIDDLDPLADNYSGISTVAGLIEAGNIGVSRIPGKHGGAPERYATLIVLVPDKPGELGRLMTDIGDIGANIEDLSLEHSVHQPFGRASVAVLPTIVGDLAEQLQQRGWNVAEVNMGEQS